MQYPLNHEPRVLPRPPRADFCAMSPSTHSRTSSPRATPAPRSSWCCLKRLVEELKDMGVADAAIDQYGYVMATIPATPGKEQVPAIGFVAHVDTSPEVSGADVQPIVHKNYDGRDLVLPDDPSHGAARGRQPRAGGAARPRHHHRFGADAARFGRQVGRGRNHGCRGISDDASGHSARSDQDRLYAGRGSRPRHAVFRREPLRRAVRLHARRAEARRARDRKFLGRCDDDRRSRGSMRIPGTRRGAW